MALTKITGGMTGQQAADRIQDNDIQILSNCSVKPFLMAGASSIRRKATGYVLTGCGFFHGIGKYTVVTTGEYTLTQGQVAVLSNILPTRSYDGADLPAQTPTLKDFQNVLADDIVVMSRGFAGDVRSIWDGLLNNSLSANIANSMIICKPEHLTFETRADGFWYAKAVGGVLGIKAPNKTPFVNVGFDIKITAPGDFNYLISDFSGNVTVTTNYVYDSNTVILAIMIPIDSMFSVNGPYNVNGAPLGVVIPNTEYAHSVVTKPEYFYFSSVGSVWKATAIEGGMVFFIGAQSRSNVAFDLTLSNAAWNFLIGDFTTGIVTSVTDRAAAFNLLKITTRYVLVGACWPLYGLFDMRCTYAINGAIFGVVIPNIEFILGVDTPAITNTISFKNDEETPIYKDAIFKTLAGGRKANVVLETTTGGRFKRYDIHNPTYLKASDVGASARFVIETQLQTKFYKEVTKVYKGVSTGHAATLKLMTIGDSLTNGNASVLVSPMALIKDRFAAYGINVVPCGTFDQANGRGNNGVYFSEGRGSWNYKCFVGKDSSPYGQPVTISSGTGLTSLFENPFLRLATATDKANNPAWCFTNQVADPANPDGVSYATNPAYNNYYIFDFAYYLTRHTVTVPDVITIALGINDWQETGVINVDDEYLSMQIMYKQIRAALPGVKIMLIPTNGILPGDQEQWATEMFPLLERIITYCETQQATDANLHICPIYQHVARFNAYKNDVGAANISTWNNIRQATTSDVHVLDKESSRGEYMDAFEATLLGII